jgi:hypothetical protein
MSWTTIGGVSDEQVDAVATGSNVQVTIGSLPNEVGLMLPRALAEGLHPTLGEALAQAPPMPELRGCKVIPVLVERALQLLARIERVNVSTLDAAVVAAAWGEEPQPGIERGGARGSLVVRPDRNAGEAVEPLVQVGVITWDGRPLCSGQTADESELRGYKPRPRERSAAA